MSYKGNIDYEINFTEEKELSLKIKKELTNEDRYFLYEMTRYFLGDFLVRENKKIEKGSSNFSEDDYSKLVICESVLNSISQQIGHIIYDTKDMDKVINDLLYKEDTPNYNFSVNTIDDLYKVKYTRFLINELWFERKEGLRVLVTEINRIFELQGGIDNKHWVEL